MALVLMFFFKFRFYAQLFINQSIPSCKGDAELGTFLHCTGQNVSYLWPPPVTVTTTVSTTDPQMPPRGQQHPPHT